MAFSFCSVFSTSASPCRYFGACLAVVGIVEPDLGPARALLQQGLGLGLLVIGEPVMIADSVDHLAPACLEPVGIGRVLAFGMQQVPACRRRGAGCGNKEPAARSRSAGRSRPRTDSCRSGSNRPSRAPRSGSASRWRCGATIEDRRPGNQDSGGSDKSPGGITEEGMAKRS